MKSTYDPSLLETATHRFRGFFDELQEAFVERDTLLIQFALALLSRQHVLMTGLPGTAKSLMASLVLGRIIDESTGSPSLFARQFTENTVQTDLVGPINFKTLMESGRTEHFTDEGMLGSVHAFLDEVFDGRDMLLRSTLNILQEREVKQGGAVTKGRIECAFMTSNRYIAEVLDTARETLLAFVDRISFISFVPRGFATPQGLSRVVRRHGGGFGEHPPRAYLTVQDLDVLQALADITYVPEEICDAVASLVTMLDAELAEAQRYDPKFQPTRYLSTRTAVQATNVLRAVVVYDKIFGRTDRPLQVEHRDIEWLRYYLMLNGVDRETLTARISRETDPRERRQLDIMATEAEIFDRCYSKLPPVKAPIQPRKLELKQLETMAQQARGSGDPDALGNAVQALISATESGAADASEATTLLVDTVGTLFGKALKGGLTPDLGASGGLDEHGRQLSAMANTLERSAGQGRLLAQWLRGRLLQLVDEGMTLSVSPTSTTVELLASSPSTNDLRRQIDACFVRAESLLGLRRQLRLGHEGEAPTDRAWEQTLDKLETELSLLWDARFRGRAVALLARADRSPLDKVLRSLHPILTWIGADEERFSRLGRRGELLRRVTGPRIEPLVASAFTRIDGRNRKAVIAQVESVVAELRRAGLGEVITPERFVAWAVPCLTRDDPGLDPGPSTVCDRAAYECARSKEPEVSITDTLIRIAIAALPHERHTTDKPEHTAQTVWQTLRTLDASLQARVVQLDLGRINRGVTMLEGWWATLRQSPADDAPRSVTVLEAVVQSGYLRAIRADAEPLRLSTELLHIVEVFPSSQEQVGVLRQRLRRLDTDSTAVLVRMLETQADQAWVSALAPQTPS